MNTQEIDDILSHNRVTKATFVGVFAADQLLRPLAIPASYVVNTDRANGPGEHWIAMYQDKPGLIELFDSFGRPPSMFDQKIQSFCNGLQVVWQDESLQNPLSTACGQYVCYFIYQRNSGRKFEDVVRSFCVDPEDNDNMVTSFVNETFGVETEVYDYQMFTKEQ